MYTRFSREEFGGIFLGLMAYLNPKGAGNKRMPENQRTLRRRQRSGRWETRVIWRKLHCLNPNLQSTQSPVRRKDVCNRRCALCLHGRSASATPEHRAMPSEGIQGDEWDA